MTHPILRPAPFPPKEAGLFFFICFFVAQISAATCPQVTLNPINDLNASPMPETVTLSTGCSVEEVFRCSGHLTVNEVSRNETTVVLRPYCVSSGSRYANFRIPEACAVEGERDFSGVATNEAAFVREAIGQASRHGIPRVVLRRGLQNFLRAHREGQIRRNCFVTSDATSLRPQTWHICVNESGRLLSVNQNQGYPPRAKGPTCNQTSPFRSYACVRYFGNRPNSCLMSGGAYVTGVARTRERSNRDFITLIGQEPSNLNAEMRGIGMYRAIAHNGQNLEEQVGFHAVSSGGLALSPTGGVNALCLARSERGGTPVYIYPSREDVIAFSQNPEETYWDSSCRDDLVGGDGFGRRTEVGWVDVSETQTVRSFLVPSGVAVAAQPEELPTETASVNAELIDSEDE